MREETLRELKDAGLTSITIGIETPDEATLKRYSRVAINDDRQRDFIELCRRLQIRTVAGFMIANGLRPPHNQTRIARTLDQATNSVRPSVPLEHARVVSPPLRIHRFGPIATAAG